MELLQVLKLRKRMISVLIGTAVLGVVARQVFYIPLFSAQTQLSVQKIENSPMQMALANLGTLSIDTSDRLKKYVEYLQSHEFFLVVAETLKFKEEYHRLNLTPPSELSITKRKFWKQFLASNFGNQGQRTEPHSANPEPVLVPIEQLATLIRSVTQAEISGPDSLRIRTTTLDPLTAMVLTNVVAEVFSRKTSERDYNEVTEVKRFIEKQLDSTTERLKKSESSLVDFKRHHNIISISAEHSTFTAKLTQLESDLESTRIRFEENQKLIDFYERLLSRRESQILAKGAGAIRATQSEVVSRLRQRLEQLHNKKVLLMSQGYSESSWQVEEISQEFDRTAALLRSKSPASAGETHSNEKIESPESHETAANDAAITSEGARAKLALQDDLLASQGRADPPDPEQRPRSAVRALLDAQEKTPGSGDPASRSPKPRDGHRARRHGYAGSSRRVAREGAFRDLSQSLPRRNDGIRARSLTPEEVSAWLTRADLVLAPFVDGVSARRGSVMAALAHGRPVVSTQGWCTISEDRAEFSDWSRIAALSPATDSEAFASRVVELLKNPDRALCIAQAGRMRHEELFSWPSISRRLLEHLRLQCIRKGEPSSSGETAA